MVQGAEILLRWANLLASTRKEELQEVLVQTDYAAEAAFWQNVANEFTVKTRLMWQDGWFRDYDATANEWSTQQDAMHLAPVFCGVASGRQVEQLRPFLVHPPMHSSGWAPLSWPPVVMTLVGAASAAQMPLDAAELAYRFIDAAYRSTDIRTLDEQGGLPGVTREYHRTIATKTVAQHAKWPRPAEAATTFDYANAGIEGYGWGALSIHLLTRYLLGLRQEEAGKITIAPALPQALRHAGATYRIGPVPWGNSMLGIECRVRDAKGYTMRVRCSVQTAPDALALLAPEAIQEAVEHQWEWEGAWGDERTFQLP